MTLNHINDSLYGNGMIGTPFPYELLERRNRCMLRGDAHKLYRQLKTTTSVHTRTDLQETKEIVQFYQSIDTDTLRLIYYRMIKEKNGSGIIPILVTAIPWLLFLFSTQLQNLLFKDGSNLWILFVAIYVSMLIISVILHFREKAWAALHIKMIQDILEKRNDQ